MQSWVWWLIASTASLLLLGICLLMATIRIRCTYKHRQKEDLLQLDVRMLGFTLYQLEAPLIEWNENEGTVSIREKNKSPVKENKQKKKWSIEAIKRFIKKSKEWIAHFPSYKRIAVRFFKGLTVEEFKWSTEIGTGEAASAAKVAGVVWGLKSFFCGWASHKVKWRAAQQLDVVPHFQSETFALSFSCIVSFRVGHAIRTGLALVLNYKKNSSQKVQAPAQGAVASD